MVELTAEVERAVAASLLARFPPAARDRVLAEAVTIDLPAGTVLYRNSTPPGAGLVVSGLLRIYMDFPDGRQLTLRYARVGEFLGATAVVAGPLPVNVQVVTPVRALLLNIQTLQFLARNEPEIAWAMAQDVTQLLFTLARIMAGTTLGTIRQRVARHLLDRAGAQAAATGSATWVAGMTQQELADAVGSVREVVARVLRDFRSEGLIQTTAGSITILDPEGLQDAAATE